jgi:hypothetical protein
MVLGAAIHFIASGVTTIMAPRISSWYFAQHLRKVHDGREASQDKVWTLYLVPLVTCLERPEVIHPQMSDETTLIVSVAETQTG